MEIKGEEFIKKVQLKQEKTEIEQRLNELNDAEAVLDSPTPRKPQEANNMSQLDREVQLQEEREYSDIMLGKGNSNEQNKKKYLVLGLILIILFLLTIIIIRLLTGDSKTDDSFTDQDTQNTQVNQSEENIEEQYQKIINEKLKNIQEEKQKEAALEEKIEKKLNLEKIEEKEKVVETAIKEVQKPDVFDVKKDEVVKAVEKVIETPKPVVKKVEAVKTTAKKTTSTYSTVTSEPKGTFVQIGAFSKMPNAKYLNSITSKGFKYKIYKVSINGKQFHKVLIGPYKNRGSAKLATDDIKKKLNVSGAFILTF